MICARQRGHILPVLIAADIVANCTASVHLAAQYLSILYKVSKLVQEVEGIRQSLLGISGKVLPSWRIEVVGTSSSTDPLSN